MKKDQFITGRQGDGAAQVFSGVSENSTIEKMYGESASYFAKIIKSILKPRELPYEILDVGTFRGELLGKVILELGDKYHFHKVGIDLEKEALDNNDNLDEKVLGDATHMPFSNKTIDVALCRYVLQWNNFERQKLILAELQRVCRGFAIVQHAGADNENTDEWKEKVHSLVFGGVPKVSRPQGNFSSSFEIESWMKEIDLNFIKLQDRRLDNLSSIFAEKYKLTEEESAKT